MSDEKSGSCRNRVVFCLLGFVLLTESTLRLAAAQDILSKSFIPTGVFLLASSGPEFLVALVLPYFLHIFPIWLQFSIICSFTSGGLITIALAEEVHIRLTGVCFASMGHAAAEVTFTSLSAFFEETAINWFSMGTGIGFVAGPLFYAGESLKVANILVYIEYVLLRHKQKNVLLEHRSLNNLSFHWSVFTCTAS